MHNSQTADQLPEDKPEGMKPDDNPEGKKQGPKPAGWRLRGRHNDFQGAIMGSTKDVLWHYDKVFNNTIAARQPLTHGQLDELFWPARGRNCTTAPSNDRYRNPTFLPYITDQEYLAIHQRLQHQLTHRLISTGDFSNFPGSVSRKDTLPLGTTSRSIFVTTFSDNYPIVR